MKTISLEISEEFDRQLRIQAALLDMNRSELIRAVLEEKSAQWGSLLSPDAGITRPEAVACEALDTVTEVDLENAVA